MPESPLPLDRGADGQAVCGEKTTFATFLERALQLAGFFTSWKIERDASYQPQMQDRHPCRGKHPQVTGPPNHWTSMNYDTNRPSLTSPSRPSIPIAPEQTPPGNTVTSLAARNRAKDVIKRSVRASPQSLGTPLCEMQYVNGSQIKLLFNSKGLIPFGAHLLTIGGTAGVLQFGFILAHLKRGKFVEQMLGHLPHQHDTVLIMTACMDISVFMEEID